MSTPTENENTDTSSADKQQREATRFANTEGAWVVDMETIAQCGVRHCGNSLYGRGHQVKSFKSVRGQQHVDIADVRATVQTGDRQKQRSVPSLVLGVQPCSIDRVSIDHSQSHQTHWDGRASGLLLEL